MESFDDIEDVFSYQKGVNKSGTIFISNKLLLGLREERHEIRTLGISSGYKQATATAAKSTFFLVWSLIHHFIPIYTLDGALFHEIHDLHPIYIYPICLPFPASVFTFFGSVSLVSLFVK